MVFNQDLEQITDDEHKKNKELVGKHFSEDHQNQLLVSSGLAHDKAYDIFKSKFAELEPNLAKIGKELDDKHLNDLLEAYVTEFMIHSKPHLAEGAIAAYKNRKFKDDLAKQSGIMELAKQAGLITGDKKTDAEGFAGFAGALKSNTYRSHTVMQEYVPGIKQIRKGHEDQLVMQSTFLSTKYSGRHDKLLDIMNHFSKNEQNPDGMYEIHSEDDKSKFYGLDVHDTIANHVPGMITNKKYLSNPKNLEKMGLKLKEYKSVPSSN